MLPEAMTTIGEGIRRIQCSTHKTEIRALEHRLSMVRETTFG